VLTHQSVIGQEAKTQLVDFVDPDYVVGCIGGGSNYAGLAYPFMRERLAARAKPSSLP
jgi:tryptophan synthase beta chain